MNRSRIRVQQLGVVALAPLFFTFPAFGDIIYEVDGGGSAASTSTLYSIDTSTSVVTTIGAVKLNGTTGENITGISFNPLNGLLYGAINSSGTNANSLVMITTSGAATATLVDGANSYGAHGTFGTNNGSSIAIQSVSFAADGTLFGYSKNPQEGLYKINATTGLASIVGSGISGDISGSTSGDGLAVKPGGSIYFAGEGSNGKNLYTIDPNTGAAQAVSPTLSGATGSQIKGMVFDSNGLLFASDFAPGSPFNAHLATIVLSNDQSTYQITDIGPLQKGLVGLAIAPASVPEPGSLFLCGVVTLIFGICRRAKLRLRVI